MSEGDSGVVAESGSTGTRVERGGSNREKTHKRKMGTHTRF
jgi:hypothetical protein